MNDKSSEHSCTQRWGTMSMLIHAHTNIASKGGIDVHCLFYVLLTLNLIGRQMQTWHCLQTLASIGLALFSRWLIGIHRHALSYLPCAVLLAYSAGFKKEYNKHYLQKLSTWSMWVLEDWTLHEVVCHAISTMSWALIPYGGWSRVPFCFIKFRLPVHNPFRHLSGYQFRNKPETSFSRWVLHWPTKALVFSICVNPGRTDTHKTIRPVRLYHSSTISTGMLKLKFKIFWSFC